MSRKYTVVAPDIPYFGESDSPKERWNYKEYNEFFNSFITNLQLKDITVIGHSMGGGLAFHLASKNKLISKLTLVNANGIGFSGKHSVILEIERFIFYLTHLQYWKTFLTLIRDALFHYTHHLFDISKADKIRRDYTGSTEVLQKINIPTLLLWSTNDSIFPLYIAEKFHELVQNSTLEVVDGTHDWLLCNPSLFYKKVVKFIK